MVESRRTQITLKIVTLACLVGVFSLEAWTAGGEDKPKRAQWGVVEKKSGKIRPVETDGCIRELTPFDQEWVDNFMGIRPITQGSDYQKFVEVFEKLKAPDNTHFSLSFKGQNLQVDRIRRDDMMGGLKPSFTVDLIIRISEELFDSLGFENVKELVRILAGVEFEKMRTEHLFINIEVNLETLKKEYVFEFE